VKIVVLGVTGMLGNAVVRVMAENAGHDVIAVSRSAGVERLFQVPPRATFAAGFDADSEAGLIELFDRHRPDVVVNCVGVVKQLTGAQRVLDAVPINSLLPHRLARICGLTGARLIHVSTDCVFNGQRGGYVESDAPDALDLYGTSKRWGEVVDQPHAITLRTSIIGHELASAHSLLCWFLAQRGIVRGFSRAIFSGLPTAELARVMRDLVLPRNDLHGLYHVSAAPIDKLALLRLFKAEYGHDVEIVPDDALVIDRSLDSARFREVTGYRPPAWPDLVAWMRHFG
jgi:dTDP-4-dehydrorhamnose reductase